jgi:serine/threonine protein kinase
MLTIQDIMIEPATHKVKLIDFGLCDFIRNETGDKFKRRCGSEEYVAPEVMTRDFKEFSGVKLDVWSLGVVLYCLLAAQFPFDAKKRRAIMEAGGEHPTVKFPFEISPLGRDLLTKMLENDPNVRISMKEVALHPWLN